jgi:hypothetical protein
MTTTTTTHEEQNYCTHLRERLHHTDLARFKIMSSKDKLPRLANPPIKSWRKVIEVPLGQEIFPSGPFNSQQKTLCLRYSIVRISS